MQTFALQWGESADVGGDYLAALVLRDGDDDGRPAPSSVLARVAPLSGERMGVGPGRTDDQATPSCVVVVDASARRRQGVDDEEVPGLV